MSSEGKNLSDVSVFASQVALTGLKIGIIQAVWNEEITNILREGAEGLLIERGLKPSQLIHVRVSGAMELPLAALWLLEKVDGVIVLGCVVRGGTPHFEYVCQGTTQGIIDVQLKIQKPVIYGLLTVNTEQEAWDRAGGKYGNKGREAGATLLQQLEVRQFVETL
ncbi:MAG: 6,7-dimethyl-8-ribityllumazine synthase [Bacteroidia bacterium]|jgi:6,7-dimethyl-8-ribityllumazine synthase